MTRQEFIDFLVENEIPYSEYTEKGLDQVWVFAKMEYKLKKKHPRKYKDLYVPYLRVSHFDEDRWYTRYNGWTSYMSVDRVLEVCRLLAKES